MIWRNKEKLIDALRNCSCFEQNASCSKCSYINEPHCRWGLMRNAADALEALQARADKQDAEITELLAVITKNDTEMDNLKTELLNAQDEAKYERQRLRLCEENLEATMVSETTYREMCEALRKQLRESNENYEQRIDELEKQIKNYRNDKMREDDPLRPMWPNWD